MQNRRVLAGVNRLRGPGKRAAAVTVAIFAAVAAAATGQAGDATPRQPAPQFVGSVALGEPLFWDGELFVERAIGTAAPVALLDFDRATDRCATPDDPITPCWAYQFDVTEVADTLRVAIDLNSREDCFLLEIFRPGTYDSDEVRPPPNDAPQDGEDTDIAHCPEAVLAIPQTWNKENFMPRPEVGRWTVRLMPHRVENLGFRFRAALENEEPEDSKKGVTPNLRPYPPYEFGFVAPAHPVPGNVFVANDHQNPPGPPGISCTRDERAEAAQRGADPLARCLRLSFGLYNLGPGQFDLLLEGEGLRGPAIQRIHAEDGTLVKQIPVGEWEFHAAHGHKHYVGPEGASPWVTLQLYRVLDSSKGILEFVSAGAKTGMGPADERFLVWERVAQGRQGAGGCNLEAEACVGLTNGWGDHYRWQRPGNYVPFPVTDADDDYLVRLVIDPSGELVETGRRDNAAYAWIRVKGDQVTICERGVGLSPWDHPKIAHEPSFWLGMAGGTTADSRGGNCS